MVLVQSNWQVHLVLLGVCLTLVVWFPEFVESVPFNCPFNLMMIMNLQNMICPMPKLLKQHPVMYVKHAFGKRGVDVIPMPLCTGSKLVLARQIVAIVVLALKMAKVKFHLPVNHSRLTSHH